MKQYIEEVGQGMGGESKMIHKNKPWEWVLLAIVVLMYASAIIISGNAVAQLILQ